MSIIFRRIRGHIVPIRTDGARKKSPISEKATKAVAIGTVAGGAGYVAFRKTYDFVKYGAEKAEAAFDKAARKASTMYKPNIGNLRGIGEYFRNNQREFKLGKGPDASAPKIRYTKKGKPDMRFKAKPQPPFRVSVKPPNPDDILKFMKEARRAEKFSKIASRITKYANAGKRGAMFVSTHSKSLAIAVGIGAAGIALYEQLKGRKK